MVHGDPLVKKVGGSFPKLSPYMGKPITLHILAFIAKRIISMQTVGSEEERKAYIVLVNLLQKEAGYGNKKKTLGEIQNLEELGADKDRPKSERMIWRDCSLTMNRSWKGD